MCSFVLFAGPEQAFKQILEKNPNASVDLYYKAAEMATETLKSTLVRDLVARVAPASRSIR